MLVDYCRWQEEREPTSLEQTAPEKVVENCLMRRQRVARGGGDQQVGKRVEARAVAGDESDTSVLID